MPRRNVLLAVLALAALGGASGCEKQSPYITMSAHGVVVKARATKYCREGGKCTESTDNPVLVVRSGDTLGIDVPRSVAEQGWRIGGQGDFRHDHYQAIPITRDFQSGSELAVQIQRNDQFGAGEWRFTIRVK